MSLLSVEDVVVDFGGNRAVDNVTLHVDSEEVVALIGPNGAGKSTLVNIIAGRFRPTHGAVTFDDQPMHKVRAHHRPRLGLVRTYQDLQLFSGISVADNVRAAAEIGGRARRRSARERTESIIAELGLEHDAGRVVRSLSYGSRKLTELGRALALSPKLLLLDEPAAGLDGAEKVEFSQVLRRSLASRGCALLVVEHDMPTVKALAERVYVLDAGRLIAHGSFAEISSDPRVVEAYLGRE